MADAVTGDAVLEKDTPERVADGEMLELAVSLRVPLTLAGSERDTEPVRDADTLALAETGVLLGVGVPLGDSVCAKASSSECPRSRRSASAARAGAAMLIRLAVPTRTPPGDPRAESTHNAAGAPSFTDNRRPCGTGGPTGQEAQQISAMIHSKRVLATPVGFARHASSAAAGSG